MAIYALGDRIPKIDDGAFVHPEAVVIGSVELGAGSSVWPCAVLRGDYGRIAVGRRTSVQDGAVLHATAELDTIVGEEVVIGHLAHIEGAVIEDRSLIGVGAKVLHRAVVRTGATVGANAVVTNGMEVPADALAVGVPATIKAGRSHPELIALSAAVYVDNTARYLRDLRRLD